MWFFKKREAKIEYVQVNHYTPYVDRTCEDQSETTGGPEPEFEIRTFLQEPTYLIGGFSDALLYLKSGNKVTRAGWNGPDQYLELQVPDGGSKMSLPYIYITTVQGDRVPWLASQTDMLANDWRGYR